MPITREYVATIRRSRVTGAIHYGSAANPPGFRFAGFSNLFALDLVIDFGRGNTTLNQLSANAFAVQAAEFRATNF